jgi:hypothetical protein
MRNWKVETKKRERWRKEIGKVIACKRAEVLKNEKKKVNNDCQWLYP